MRLNYSDNEDYPGQFQLWQANCDRSLAGKRGQSALRELEAALLALPEPRLTHGALCTDGEVCAIGALAVHRRVTAGEAREAVLAELDALPDKDYGTDDYGEEQLGLPRLVAWKIVCANDVEAESRYRTCEGPNEFRSVWHNQHGYRAGYSRQFDYTPEERYDHVLSFVREHLKRS